MESTLKPRLVDLTRNPKLFFDVLPEDWRVGIEPFWPEYQDGSFIFGISISDEIIGGGIVFSKVSPDTKAYELEAQKLFKAGMLYFGFLWVSPNYRGQELGSLWIQEVKKKIQQPLWLSIEEKGLQNFYERNDFRIYKEISIEEGTEWIMIPKESNLF